MTTTENRSASARLYERARRCMPGGVSSPVRAFGAMGGKAVFLRSARGAYVVDADGNRYVDLVGTWGPAIVGHAHPEVVEAVRRAAADGLSFGACCEAEAELAELILSAFPSGSMEMIRFVSTGTEATMSAVRLARAATGRDKILKFEGNYHGHADGFLVSAGSGAATFGAPTSPGVTGATAGDTLPARYNDIQQVSAIMQTHGTSIAAIIVEPIAGNMGMVRPAPGFLEGLRGLCDAHGALLIFDEVMTGFRVAWGGYQNVCGVKPDLTTLGKVIGGGMPLAAYAGPRSLMKRISPTGPVYQAGTLSGNPVALAAGIATLRLCAGEGFYDALHAATCRLADGIGAAAASAGRSLSVDAQGGMLGLAFTPRPPANFDDARAADHAAYARFFHAMLGRGVWLPPSSYEALFVSSAHGHDEIDCVIAKAEQSFGETG